MGGTSKSERLKADIRTGFVDGVHVPQKVLDFLSSLIKGEVPGAEVTGFIVDKDSMIFDSDDGGTFNLSVSFLVEPK